MITKICSITLR